MSAQRKQRQYIAVLAAISAGILIVGSQFRPDRTVDEPVSQAEFVRLQTLAQRQNLQSLTRYFSGVSDGIRPSVVWIDGLDRSGIVWGATGQILTSSPDEVTQHELTAGSGASRVRVSADVVSPSFPVAALVSEEPFDLPTVFRAAARSLTPGSWILHVAAVPGGEHIESSGNFQGVVPRNCEGTQVDTVATSLPLSRSSAGGGIFDLEGDLLALVLQCDDEYLAVAPDDVDRIVQQAKSLEGQMLRRYGLRLQALDEQSKRHFEADQGVLVGEVIVGSPADAAGIEPGDVIQAIDSSPVTTATDLQPLVLPVAFPSFQIFVSRRGRVEQLELQASGSDFEGAHFNATQGIEIGSPAAGIPIDRVVPGSPADRASLRPGDRLLSVNGRVPSTGADTVKALAATGDVFVVAQRGNRKLGAFLQHDE